MLPSLEPALHDPERIPFIRKQLAFLADHGLDSGGTLVIQCRPVESTAIDPMGARMDNTLLQGVSQRTEGAWWDGFGGGTRKPTFDGHATVDRSGEKSWVVEVQDDGHILAAIRAVAYIGAPGMHLTVLAVFPEFALFAGAIRAAAGITGASKLTATLVNAKGLKLVGSGSHGGARLSTVNRELLEWPVVTAANEQEIVQACDQMRIRLKRIFP